MTTPFTLDEARHLAPEMPRVLATVQHTERIAAEVAKRVLEAAASEAYFYVSIGYDKGAVAAEVRNIDIDAIVRDVLEGR